MTEPQPAIAARNLLVRYGEVTALDGASLEVGAGRICALIGMNGAGKSTLFRALMGQVRLDAGTVQILGLDPAEARRTGLLGYVPQHEAVDWDFPVSVRTVVAMGRYGRLGIRRTLRAADRDAVAAALEQVRLTELADRPIGALSGGERKRAFIARCIAQEAQVLLLDEPFAGVDRPSEALISDLLRSLAAQGVATLIATHDLQAVPALADEVALLRRRVLAHGSPAETLRPERLALAFGMDGAAA